MPVTSERVCVWYTLDAFIDDECKVIGPVVLVDDGECEVSVMVLFREIKAMAEDEGQSFELVLLGDERELERVWEGDDSDGKCDALDGDLKAVMLKVEFENNTLAPMSSALTARARGRAISAKRPRCMYTFECEVCCSLAW